MTWNMAGLRARNYRTYKPCKPVGDERTNLLRGPSDVHCKGCGYYVCSCDPLFVKFPISPKLSNGQHFEYPVQVGIEHGQTAGLPDSAWKFAQKACEQYERGELNLSRPKG
jgi:hypothetical protein